MLAKIIKKPIELYQRFISPSLGAHCRFYPTCSSYALLAIDKYGAFKGLFKSLGRLLKCNPYHKGGVDLP